MPGVTLIDRGDRDDLLDRGRDRRGARIASSIVRFEKWQALGNDYIVIEAAALPWELTAERIERICAPHFGVGSDGILLLSRAEDDRHVAELRIFNPDGSEAELSGNGAREAVLYLRAAGWTDRDTFTIVTKAGELTPTITGAGEVSMAIGRASLTSADYPVRARRRHRHARAPEGASGRFRHVNVGNPQCVIEAGDELEALEIASFGPEIEAHELFPNRTNVSFIRVDGSRVRARIFERGVGETLSSGTGASGAAVAAFLAGAPSPITVTLDGGELTRRGQRRARPDPDRNGLARLLRRARPGLRRRARTGGDEQLGEPRGDDAEGEIEGGQPERDAEQRVGGLRVSRQLELDDHDLGQRPGHRRDQPAEDRRRRRRARRRSGSRA